MKILLYGESHLAGTGAWCYVEALRELGHSVVAFSDRSGFEKYGRPLSPWRVLRKLRGSVLPWDRRRHGNRLCAAVADQKPELVIVLKGLNVAGEDVRQMQASGAWVCNVNHDDFFSHNPNNWSQVQRQAIPQYNFIFTTREVNVAEVLPLNPHVEFFPFAWYPRIHRQIPIPPAEVNQWNVDVVFVGTYERARAGLLETLVSRVPARYAIYGAQWHKLSPSSPLRQWTKKTELWCDDQAKALGGAKIALGFLRKENRDDYTQRTFEIPACGGLLLAERTARHLSFYKEGVEAEFFQPESASELCAKTALLLENEPRREAMRAAGRAALLRQQHTYQDRLEHLFAVYHRAKAAPVPTATVSPESGEKKP